MFRISFKASKNPENIHAVFMRCGNKLSTTSSGIVPVADEVFDPGGASGLGVFFSSFLRSRRRSQGSSFKNRIQVSKVASPPCFNRKKTTLIESPCKGQHILRPEPGRDQRLVRIAEGCISDLHFTGNNSIHGGTSRGVAGIHPASQNFNGKV